MTLTQLEYFLEIARTRSFTEAASNLFVSQSSLSYAIRELENELDVSLFVRRLNGDENIVVVGGGVNGCEVALALAEEGHKVTVVELMETFANGLGALNRLSLLETMKQNENITMLNKTKCICIKDHILECEDTEGNPVRLPFDLVVACIGMGSENKLGKEVLAEFPEAYMIGDAVEHKRIGDAVHQAFFTGMRI